MRIILSEAGQSSNDDLSRSAYDSAMAGVEDAKTAVNRYYECLSSGLSADRCGGDNLFKTDCDDTVGLAKFLYGDNYTGGEVLLQQNTVGSEADNATDQAYTCVVISDRVSDYRGTLSTDTRTKVIPLRVQGVSTTEALNQIDSVTLQWYSILNEGNSDEKFNTHGNTKLQNRSNATVPPTIQLAYIKASADTKIDDYHQVNTGEDNYIYATTVIVPTGVDGSSRGVTISRDELKKMANVDASIEADKINYPVGVVCNSTAEFACTVELTDLKIQTTDTAFLVVSLPYDNAVTDFVATIYSGTGEDKTAQKLVGVQISVDSTGRTNDLVRRVETRLDRADLFFPYPQYAADLNGGDDDSFGKNRWITANCWGHQPISGKTGTCAQNGFTSP